MDIFLFYGLMIIILLLIVSGIIFLSYWIPKRLGYKKLGKIISRILIIGLIIIILSIVFEDLIFFKSNARGFLKTHDIELTDKFKIISNNKSGIRDYSHKFELKISENDKNQTIKQIIDSEGFFKDSTNNFYLPRNIGRYSEKMIKANYENDWYYRRESYETFTQGHAPCLEIISVSKDDNILIFEQIYD